MNSAKVFRKELRRRRYASISTVCVVSIVVLAMALFLPRFYSTHFVLRFNSTTDSGADSVDSAMGRVFGQIGSYSPDSGSRCRPERRDPELEIRCVADSAQKAFEDARALNAAIAREELSRLRRHVQDEERELSVQVADADTVLRGIDAELNKSRAALPQGGEAAVGARIGKLQGELDALDVAIQQSRETLNSADQRALKVRRQIAEMQSVIGAATAIESKLDQLRRQKSAEQGVESAAGAANDGLAADIAKLEIQYQQELVRALAARDRLHTLLEPELHQIEVHQSTLRDDLASRGKQRGQIDEMVKSARSQSVSVEAESQSLREMQRRYDNAAATQRQLSLRLQEKQLDISMPTTLAALPFEVTMPATMPHSPDGWQGWSYSLLAVLMGALVAAVRLMSGFVRDDRLRLADTIVAEVEVPVLAVIPELVPAQAATEVRWQFIVTTMLCIVTVAGHALFVIYLG